MVLFYSLWFKLGLIVEAFTNYNIKTTKLIEIWWLSKQ